VESKVTVTATVGVVLSPLAEHGDWSAEALAPVPDPPPPGQVATLPTDCTRPPTVEVPSGSTTDTASPGASRYSWVTGRSTVTIGVVPVAVRTVPPPPPPLPLPPAAAPSDAATEVTRIGPGSKTTWPSRMAPVAGSPRAVCQRSTAAAVVEE